MKRFVASITEARRDLAEFIASRELARARFGSMTRSLWAAVVPFMVESIERSRCAAAAPLRGDFLAGENDEATENRAPVARFESAATGALDEWTAQRAGEA